MKANKLYTKTSYLQGLGLMLINPWYGLSLNFKFWLRYNIKFVVYVTVKRHLQMAIALTRVKILEEYYLHFCKEQNPYPFTTLASLF